jgi:hypothetical protein
MGLDTALPIHGGPDDPVSEPRSYRTFTTLVLSGSRAIVATRCPASFSDADMCSDPTAIVGFGCAVHITHTCPNWHVWLNPDIGNSLPGSPYGVRRDLDSGYQNDG